jgi:hypothetical protein
LIVVKPFLERLEHNTNKEDKRTVSITLYTVNPSCHTFPESKMKFLHAALLLLASPLHAFVPHKPALKGTRISQRPDGHRLQLAPEELPFGLREVVGGLDKVNFEINDKYQTILKSLLSQVQTVLSEESTLQTEFTLYATKLSEEIDRWLLQQNPAAEALYQQVLSQLRALTIDSPEVFALSTLVTFFVMSSVLTWGQPPPSSKPYPLQRYDPVGAQVYFDGKSVEAVSRALQIAAKSLGFALSLLKDKVEYVDVHTIVSVE